MTDFKKDLIKKIIIASQLILTVGLLNAQKKPVRIDPKIDRSREKVDAMNALAGKYVEKKNDSCVAILNQTIKLSTETDYKKGIADATNLMGVFYRNRDDFEKAQGCFFKALRLYEAENNLPRMAVCYNNIGNVHNRSGNAEKALFYYFKATDIYLDLKQYDQYSQTCNNIGVIFYEEDDNKQAIEYCNKGLRYSDSVKFPESYAHLLKTKGSAFQSLDQQDSSRIYYQKAVYVYKKHNLEEGLCVAYFDIGYSNEINGSLQTALYYYHLSLKLAKKLKRYYFMDNPLEGLMLVHNQLKNNDSVEYYYYELDEVNKILFKEKTNKNIHDADTKYQTEKKEQALILEKERRTRSEEINNANKQTISFLSIAVALALVLILGIWAYQSQKQQLIKLNLKQKNDEIERMINQQQVKSYESQLEGEAIERKRIASELHDRVGGLLATLNLHFEVLTEKKELLEEGQQIQQLIRASIDEVRTISHNLHGIGQSKGLFNALEQLQKAISSSGKIEMSVYYEIGSATLPEKLNGELYKIVQELTTDTLKHAGAKKISVQLSVIENVLHLIYEDDGSGFDTASVKKGMGISNVAERVDNFNGNWDIDSKIGRGTTVIINIPLE